MYLDALNGEVGTIVVNDIFHLVRDITPENASLFDQLRDHGVRLISVAEQIDTLNNDPEMASVIFENGFTYFLHGDCYLPIFNLAYDDRPIGRWGMERLQYEMDGDVGAFFRLAVEYHERLVRLNHDAERRFQLIIRQMKEQEGVTEALKAADQMEWVRRMNTIRSRAEEIIRNEVIYTGGFRNVNSAQG